MSQQSQPKKRARTYGCVWRCDFYTPDGYPTLPNQAPCPNGDDCPDVHPTEFDLWASRSHRKARIVPQWFIDFGFGLNPNEIAIPPPVFGPANKPPELPYKSQRDMLRKLKIRKVPGRNFAFRPPGPWDSRPLGSDSPADDSEDEESDHREAVDWYNEKDDSTDSDSDDFVAEEDIPMIDEPTGADEPPAIQDASPRPPTMQAAGPRPAGKPSIFDADFILDYIDPSPPDFPFPYLYANVARWDSGLFLALANTDYIPMRADVADNEPLGVCSDAYWGPHEWTQEPQPFDRQAPHLAFIPLPCSKEDADDAFCFPDFSNFEHFDSRAGWQRITKSAFDRIAARSSHLKNAFHIARRLLADAFALGEADDEDDLEKAKRKRDEEPLGQSSQPATSAPSNIDALLARSLTTPTSALSRMENTAAHMRFTGARSKAELVLCWRAHQRAALEVEAYVAFCAKILPDKYRRQELRAQVPHRHHARRGVIFQRDHIDRYYNYYLELGVPVYAIVDSQGHAISDEDLLPRSAPRQDTRLCMALDDVHRKDLDDYCYPPPGNVVWEKVELVARGVLPPVLEIKGSTWRTAYKKRIQNASKEKNEQRNIALSKRPYTNGARFTEVMGSSPALMRALRFKLVSRPPFLPSALGAFEEARQWAEASEWMRELEGSSDALRSYFPSAQQFYTVTSEGILVRMCVMLVRIMPFLRWRLQEARRDPTLKPLKARDWREYLRGQKYSFHAEDSPGGVGVAGWWRKAPKEYFGVRLYKTVDEGKLSKAEEEELNRLHDGRLACGCEATHEKIDGDFELIAGIVRDLSEVNVAIQLASLAKGHLKNFPQPPNPFGSERSYLPLWAINYVAFGCVPFNRTGWPDRDIVLDFESAQEMHNSRVQVLLNFFATAADHDDIFRNPPEGREMGCSVDSATLMPLFDEQMDGYEISQWETHIFRRLFVSCFKTKQWPVEWLEPSGERGNWCKACRGSEGPLTPQHADWQESLAVEAQDAPWPA